MTDMDVMFQVFAVDLEACMGVAEQGRVEVG